MPLFHKKPHWNVVLILLVIALSGCGGGGGGGGGSSNGPDVSTPQGRLNAAMAEGDSSLLSPADASYVVTSLNDVYQQKLQDKKTLLLAFYKGLSSRFEKVPESQLMQPAAIAMGESFPLVVGDKGNVMATFSMYGGGRIVAYGYDILAGFTRSLSDVPTNQNAHRDVVKRVLAWLVSNDATRDLSSQPAESINIAWASMPRSNKEMYTRADKTKVYLPNAAAGLTVLGIPYKNLLCDPLVDPIADCAAKAHLIVLGGSVYDDRNDMSLANKQASRIKEWVAAKIPILYLNSHPASWYNDWASGVYAADVPRIAALGLITTTDGKGNTIVQDSVTGGSDLNSKITAMDNISDFLDRLAHSSFTKNDWTQCKDDSICAKPMSFVNEIVSPLIKLKSQLDDINTKGQNLFDPQVGSKTLQQLVLWADAYRKNIKYPIDKITQYAEFQKAYIADTLVSYVRKTGSAQTDLGNLVGVDIRQVNGSSQMETVTVTLPGSDGATAVGRFVLPGQALTVQLQNPPEAGTFKFFINTAGEGNTKLYTPPVDSNGNPSLNVGYRRPRLPQSPDFPLSSQPITIVSPYGGLLQLRYAAATSKSVVLKIQGAARQPFYDNTQGMPDTAAFLSDIQTNKLGWLEIKSAYIDIHSLISLTKNLLFPDPDPKKPPTLVTKPYYISGTKSIDMAKYLAEADKYVILDAYRLAGLQNGTDDLKLNPRVLAFCTSHQWNCENINIHKVPVAFQHQNYHLDYAANCGWMCSGNPITSGGGFDPRGWGESHELGHNLVRFKIYDRTSTEVANNIYPLHKKWRLLVDLKREAIDYSNYLFDAQLVFETLKTAYLSSGDKLAKAKNDVWVKGTGNGMLYFYLQWPLLYAEALKNDAGPMTEADIEAGWDINILMNLNLREVEASTDWSNDRAKLGFSIYNNSNSSSNKPETGNSGMLNGIYLHHDYMLIVLSLITGRDQTPLFNFWGVETSANAKAQVAALRDSRGHALPSQPVKFYATHCFDDLINFQTVNFEAGVLDFPWPDEFRNLSDTTPVPPATVLSGDQNKSISDKDNRHKAACLRGH